MPIPFQFPFDFFGPEFPPDRAPRDRVLRRRALGSGFIIDADGHVVTNAHVIANATTVKVRLLDDREFTATVRGADDQLDVAVLDIADAQDLPSVPLGSSDAMRVGDYVVAIGNPFGLGDTVTMGIISAKSRAIGAGPYDDFLQTDAAVNPGNSGGPMLNTAGEVVGINTAINPNGQGIGFAIPIDDVKQVLPQLLARGHVTRGHLGVTIQPMDEATAKALGLDRARGALISDVAANGPAAKAGLRAGDVILSVDREEIRNAAELPHDIALRAPGSKVDLTAWRNGRQYSFTVTLGEAEANRRAEPATRSPERPGMAEPRLGLALSNTQAGPTVVEVRGGSAADGQLQPGDVILEVNREAVRDVDGLERRIEQAPRDRPILLKIRRGGDELFVGLERK